MTVAFAAVGVHRGGPWLLRGVDWAVGAGERWVVLGPNGAGKTTMLRLAGALDHPTTGTVDVLGHRLGRVDLRRLRERIGFVSGALARELRPTVRAVEVVASGLHGALETWWHEYGPADWAQARDLLSLGRVAPEREWAVLSEGERQQTLLARALMADPDLLLLDEPFAGLDLGARERLLRRLDHVGGERPVVLVTHHVEEVPTTATHALLLRQGTVVAGGPVDEVLSSQPVSAAFGLRVRIGRDGDRWWARAGT